MNQRYEVINRLKHAEADLAYSLHVFGDYLAEREGYKTVSDIDAVRYYLIQKHNWLPYQVKSMSDEDIRFCLTEEMHGWVLPPEAKK